MPSPKKMLVLKRFLNILVTKQALSREEETPRKEKLVTSAPPELNEISEILDGQLYLSGCRVVDADHLNSLGITAVVRAITETEERIMMDSTSGAIRLPDHVSTLYVRLPDVEASDIQSHFERVSQFIDAHSEKGEKVLVHCGAGISRSTCLVMAYLISHKHLTLRQAYALVRSKRKIVRPNNGFFRQLIEHERQTREDGRASVRMILTSNGISVPDIIYENALMAKLR